MVLVSSAVAGARAEVTAERNDHGAAVKIDGKLFTEYLTKAGHAPALYPVIGPTGKPVTRSYPFTPPVKDGTNDHPHHQSLWMTHGDVNGIDFWGANVDDDKGTRACTSPIASLLRSPAAAIRPRSSLAMIG